MNIKVQFTKDTAFANQKFLFLIRISTKFPSPVKFTEIQIAFNDASYSTKIESESRILSEEKREERRREEGEMREDRGRREGGGEREEGEERGGRSAEKD